MKNLSNPKWIWFKGILFFALGITAASMLLMRSQDLQTGILFVISIWAFCRAYYFAFYVIEKYVDSSFRFAGLIHFLRYAFLGHRPD